MSAFKFFKRNMGNGYEGKAFLAPLLTIFVQQALHFNQICRMKKSLILFPALLFAVLLCAQNTPVPTRATDFSITMEGAGVRFYPEVPPLQQTPGAPPAYYTCFWEFGDGSFSTEKSPLHLYANADSAESVLLLTLHYDDGEMPKKKKKTHKVPVNKSAIVDASKMPGNVFTTDKQAIALRNAREPRANEEMILVLSYRNNSVYTTDGVLHLFYNEKKYPSPHFQFQEARAHFGETPASLYSDAAPILKTIDWAALSAGICSVGESAPFFYRVSAPKTDKILSEARGLYREEKAWRFSELHPHETRNLFISLDGSASMLRDTSAMIHLLGVFAPFDPAVTPDTFQLDMEIVNSHDPNTISVSDTRVGYRKLKKNRLEYKVRFQNNGERQAENIALKIEIPDGLNAARMQPLDWYPKCPICPEKPTLGGCLDTAITKDGLAFTFRNIYLPGSNQRGVTEYDSTKGFVKYRIVPEKRMPKRAFRSRASIIFDKNPPIYTNYSKTRFKPGISPGLKVGYGFAPDSLKNGYLYFGATLSPFKSWRIYPQLELLVGAKGRSDLPSDTSIVRIKGIFDATGIKPDTLTVTIRNGNRRFSSFEMPLLLRKNFSRFIGLGVGASARVILEKGEDVVFERVRQEFYEPGISTPFAVKVLKNETTTTPYSATRTEFRFFADLTLGFVRAGPHLGIRVGALADKGLKPFVQLGLEINL
jgi:hypothetical protein